MQIHKNHVINIALFQLIKENILLKDKPSVLRPALILASGREDVVNRLDLVDMRVIKNQNTVNQITIPVFLSSGKEQWATATVREGDSGLEVDFGEVQGIASFLAE